MAMNDHKSEINPNQPLGIVLIMTSAVLGGATAIMLRQMGKSFHPVYSSFYMGIGGII